MGNELSLINHGPLAISMRHGKPSQSWLVKTLTVLATARQASVSKDTFLIYASELVSYREDDVSAAIRKIALRPRAEGETAFPDLGTLVAAVRGIQGERLRAEERMRSSEEQRQLEEDRRLHPEKYLSYDEIIREFHERRRNA